MTATGSRGWCSGGCSRSGPSGRVDTVLRWMAVARAAAPDRALPGGCRARRADLRAAIGRPASDRMVGGGGRAGHRNRPTLPDGSTMASYLALSARRCCAATGSRRCARDAQTRLGRAQPRRAPIGPTMRTPRVSPICWRAILDRPTRSSPIAFDDGDPAMGAAPLAAARPGRAASPASRAVRLAGRRYPWRSKALAIVQDRRVRRLLDQRPGLRLGGPGRDPSRQPRREPASTRRGPPACARSSPTRSRSCRSRPCWSWPGRTSRSTDPDGARGRPAGRRTGDPPAAARPRPARQLRPTSCEPKSETIRRQGPGRPRPSPRPSCGFSR